MKFFEKIRKNIFSIAGALLFLALLVLLNVFTGMLTERFFLKADLTDTGLYTLSERAAEFLSGVDESVEIIVLAEESVWRATSPFDRIYNILGNFASSSGGYLRVQYADPDLNSFDGPNYNNSLSELKAAHAELENISRNDIIFLSSRRATTIAGNSLFAQGTDAYGRAVLAGVVADQELVSALIYVLNERVARITFVSNHQEIETAQFGRGFERSGYVSSTINLATQEIPEDTIVLVTAAPQFDFLDDEIVKLEQYLSLGGTLVYLYDYTLTNTPMLDKFLAEWGITVQDKLIFDEDYTFVPQVGIIGAYVVAGDLPFTESAQSFTTEMMPLGVYYAKPITLESVGRFHKHLPLVSTFSASSYAKDISSGNISTMERESGDESGPFNIAYNVRQQTRNAENEQVNANLIVAPLTMFDDTILSLYGDSFFNNYFISSLASDLNPFGSRVYIPAKGFTDNSMLISSSGVRTILIVLVIMMPLAIITAGVIVWRKRRHK